MSLYGALFSGVSGLQAQSNKISALSDNIANVNTVGYKASQGLFESLVTSGGGSGFSQGGVIGTARKLVDQQGLLQSTSSPTDVAISGSGFFIVNQTSDATGQLLYTRAGNFTQDATGNFKNAAGFFLQAWPLDRNGLLPGAPGNLNTTSSANLSSLQTVNVQNLTGTATATSNVSIGANLNSTQAAFGGAAGIADMDAQDSINVNNGADDIIIPTAIDSLTRGDQFIVSAAQSGLNYTYTYGGFSISRNAFTGAAGDSGVGVLGNGQTTITAAAVNLGNNPVLTGGIGTGTVTITSTAHGLAVGDVVTLAGLAATDGITAPQLNTTHVITAVTANTFTVVTAGAATVGGQTGGGAGSTSTTQEFKTTSGTNVVRVRHATHGLTDGQTITLSGVDTALSGIPISELNTSFIVDVIDANHYDIQVVSNAAATTGGGSTTNIVADSRQFTGQILNANLPTDTFLGSTSANNFTAAALTFTISSPGAGTATFTYGCHHRQYQQLEKVADSSNLPKVVADFFDSDEFPASSPTERPNSLCETRKSLRREEPQPGLVAWREHHETGHLKAFRHPNAGLDRSCSFEQFHRTHHSKKPVDAAVGKATISNAQPTVHQRIEGWRQPRRGQQQKDPGRRREQNESKKKESRRQFAFRHQSSVEKRSRQKNYAPYAEVSAIVGRDCPQKDIPPVAVGDKVVGCVRTRLGNALQVATELTRGFIPVGHAVRARPYEISNHGLRTERLRCQGLQRRVLDPAGPGPVNDCDHDLCSHCRGSLR